MQCPSRRKSNDRYSADGTFREYEEDGGRKRRRTRELFLDVVFRGHNASAYIVEKHRQGEREIQSDRIDHLVANDV